LSNESLLESRFDLAEHKRNVWFATVPDGVEPQDLLEQTFWAHVAQRLRPLDLIEVVNDSCQWRVELLCEEAWFNGARVSQLGRHDLSPLAEPELTQDLRIQWRGPHSKFCMVRRDGVLVKDKIPTREVALQHLTALSTERVA
jgi:hypothetical protein